MNLYPQLYMNTAAWADQFSGQLPPTPKPAFESKVKTVSKQTYMNARGYLQGKVYQIQDTAVALATAGLLIDPDFNEAPAAKSKHHAYRGGLVVHTAEVLRGALAQAKLYSGASQDVLIAASIFHDAAKVRDYEFVEPSAEYPTGIRYTEYSKRIHHISGGYAFWKRLAGDCGVSLDLQDAVGHCILSHHGRPEYGSPVVPQTLEAAILHNADGLSAFYGKDSQRDK